MPISRLLLNRLRPLLGVATLVVAGCASNGGTAPTGNRAVDLLVETDSLQAEVKRLRNQVEVQQHDLEVLQRRQRELYDDLDRRLREQERGTAQSAAPAAQQPATNAGPATLSAPSADAQAAYDAAFDQLRQGRYGDAIAGFKEFVDRYPGNTLVPNAYYWIGEAHYVIREFDSALKAFEDMAQRFPEGEKYPDALLKIGYCQLELGQEEAGRRTLEQLIERFPGTQVALSAERRLGKAPVQ